ncbi:YdcF family protein [Hoeflea prorocentri]|uniref:YdcF family protein n=1 Tax=Hoeflea prorocentri TaxID=1922333 RepID=A0A9X3UJH2_9HYPH|nr:YdcF family protein [Hoeflea prorocentri]MCY6381716.1 YdcF family protein [Hoeflea prorocentri]MDA5399516.1 YdcF family protein [Hoeflea prorocentri]
MSAADAIVVFGAAVWAKGKPSPTLRRRTLHAIALHKDEAAPLIVLSGGLGKHPPSEAQVMASLCIDAGLKPSDLILEDRSTSTFENVAHSAKLLSERGLKKIIVVSDAYHLPRIRMCFRYLGFETTASSPPEGLVPTRRRRVLLSWLRELAALPWYWITMHKRLGATRSALRIERA